MRCAQAAAAAAVPSMLNRAPREKRVNTSTHWCDRAAVARSDLGSGTLQLVRTKSLQERQQTAMKIDMLKKDNQDLWKLFSQLDSSGVGSFGRDALWSQMNQMAPGVESLSEEFVAKIFEEVRNVTSRSRSNMSALLCLLTAVEPLLRWALTRTP